ncbi:helix-turn-helix transcriptional regulator [Paenibacillus sp. 481]|uniref:helix-turn-helix transcriptional regulator n=1 Tax=Paenibacillus sp. 481 TaxID=2835869 RepID=UPI001E3FD1F2|nr:helix-turn-helix transcriptional regulator [Paenibacillus sp. 481]UHA72144.1 helix-turn-helix transcriptional regulator [Paenibacillus sp. 481]
MNIVVNPRDDWPEQSYIEPIAIAQSWIRANCQKHITVRMIANQVYMNENYFCSYFKKNTGYTVLEYITANRMEHAKEWLQCTDWPVREIAVHAGYKDVKYFSRLFKQLVGQYPSEYRLDKLYGE